MMLQLRLGPSKKTLDEAMAEGMSFSDYKRRENRVKCSEKGVRLGTCMINPRQKSFVNPSRHAACGNYAGCHTLVATSMITMHSVPVGYTQ